MGGQRSNLTISWGGENAGLITNEGEIKTFGAHAIKHMNEKPLHKLIKYFLYENPYIISRNPLITAIEVSLKLKDDDNNYGSNIGIIDIMILEENKDNRLKGTFIEVKSSYDVSSRIERMKNGDISGLYEYLKQIAQHMAALKKYFAFSKYESRYMLAYPIRSEKTIKAFFDTFNEMFPKNDKERAVEYLTNNIDAYIGFLEVTEDELNLYKIRNRERHYKRKFDILHHFSKKNSLIMRLLKLFNKGAHRPNCIEESGANF